MDFDSNGILILPFHNLDPDPPPTTPKFHLFPYLATELRIRIWILAHPGPRSVLVTLGNHSRHSHLLPPPRPQHSLAHLSVNHEARAIFLEHHVRIFTYMNSNKPRGRGGGCYINLEQDSLCVASGLKGVRYLLQRFPNDMHKIRYLDINADSHAMHAWHLFKWDKLAPNLSQLRELKLVTLRWLTFSPGKVRRRYAFRGNFADTLEVLHIALRHHHARKHCEKEKGVRLAVQCVYPEGASPQFRDLFTILKRLGRDVVERWERMEDLFVEESGGIVGRSGRWRCRSGEIELHLEWERTHTSRWDPNAFFH
ncbi:hypothetical protein N431DRAFT_536163 [Stipitochalara longipes BDJ]|nr:hypothetical protein N431DRAFT_536163 [Stipitochalara longipes BDJ]